ncbi:accessory gene regulator ArgB-like protein [Natranaerobius thermophilus]|uniref:Accessory gene regulator B n=1 Tax=Natranaerobius thermophilus (strain ATCC BAA-1301 / DSM 18059 / JW/NM-WN-LF) TaxID=457570 RepID=B2A271_NATTJ|nr:accessory gene regulator B family protein [Natranaerobius thermophilus]ACB86179.1 Accessory gene regulator B [Natranaerobius thermophilus JW/NM-WN-LF]
MIKRLSNLLANKVGSELNRDQEDIEVYSYALEVIIGAVIKGVVFLTVGLLLGILPEFILVMAVFGIMRTVIGGTHFQCYTKCLFSTLVMILMIIWVADFLPTSIKGIAFISALLFSTSIYWILKYAPAVWNKDKKGYQDYKKTYIFPKIVSIAWIMITGGLFYYVSPLHGYLSLLSGTFASLLITSTSFKIISHLDMRLLVNNQERKEA